jgi:hypothetical protein
MSDVPQSINFASIKPLCPDHQPKCELVRLPEELGGGLTYEVSCPNCNFHGLIHPDALEDL